MLMILLMILLLISLCALAEFEATGQGDLRKAMRFQGIKEGRFTNRPSEASAVSNRRSFC